VPVKRSVSTRGAALVHRHELQRRQVIMGRELDGEAGCGGGAEADAGLGARTGRRRQANEPVVVHAQHGHPRRHLLEGAVGLIPPKLLAEQA
jgi:hypothetical protein